MPVYMYPEMLETISPELKNACRVNPVSISGKWMSLFLMN